MNCENNLILFLQNLKKHLCIVLSKISLHWNIYLVLQQKLFLDLVKKTMTTQPNNNNATVMAKTINGDQLMGMATAKAEAGVAARGGGSISGGGQK